MRLPKKVVSGMTGAEYVLFTIYTEDLFRSATPTSLLSLHQSVHPIDPMLKCTKDPAALPPIASLQRPNLSHSVHWSTVPGSVRSAYTTGRYFNELVSQTIAESRRVARALRPAYLLLTVPQSNILTGLSHPVLSTTLSVISHISIYKCIINYLFW